MSHFSVLVVGDVDYNMAPFHEFECDGINDEFIKDFDVTENRRKEYFDAMERYKNHLADASLTPNDIKYDFKGTTFREFLGDYNEIPIVEKEEDIDTKDKHKFGYALCVGPDDFKVIHRTNPNVVYDYYRGGYEAFNIKGKKEKASTALKKDIDFKRMYEEAEERARNEHRYVMSALGYTNGRYPRLKTTWASLVDKFWPNDDSEPQMTKEEAEKIYNNQAFIKKWNKASKEKKLTELGWFANADSFAMSEDDYVKSQMIHSFSYGYVIDRKYYSRGKMGWFGMSSDDKSASDWDEQYKKFIEELPDDAQLTMLDCHI